MMEQIANRRNNSIPVMARAGGEETMTDKSTRCSPCKDVTKSGRSVLAVVSRYRLIGVVLPRMISTMMGGGCGRYRHNRKVTWWKCVPAGAKSWITRAI
jgi:hypothetical protein